MKKRLLALLLALTLSLSLLAGCSSEPAEEVASETTDTATSTATDEGDTAEDGGELSTEPLRFIDVSPSPQRQEYYEGVFAEFATNTGIEVTYESVPWDDAANKLTVMGTSNQLPDVITTHGFWLGQFTESEWILPLDDYVNENMDQFVQVVQDVNFAQEMERYGNIYSIPDGFMVKGIFYRKDWVEEIGYEIPTGDDWTYDAYFDLIAALYDEEQNRYGNSFRGARGAFDPILTYLHTLTGGYTYDEEGNFLMNTPEAVEALEKWASVYIDGYVPEDSINWGFVEMVDNFTGGLTGTLHNDSEVAKSCEDKMQPEQWGVLPLPVSTVDGMNYNTSGSPYSYTVASTTANKDGAIALIDFLVNPENNIEYCKMGGLIPINVEVSDDPTYGVDGPYAAFVEQLNSDNFVVPATYGQFNYTDLHQDMFHTELQRYLLGDQSAEDVLNNIGTELTTRMQEYLAENPDATVETPKTPQ